MEIKKCLYCNIEIPESKYSNSIYCCRNHKNEARKKRNKNKVKEGV